MLCPLSALVHLVVTVCAEILVALAALQGRLVHTTVIAQWPVLEIKQGLRLPEPCLAGAHVVVEWPSLDVVPHLLPV